MLQTGPAQAPRMRRRALLFGGLAAVTAALGGYLAGESRSPQASEPFVSAGGDQTERLNAWLAQTSTLGIKQVVGTFQISGGLTIPANTYLDASKAKFTQTGVAQTSVRLAAGATIIGGVFTGRAADYSPGRNVRPVSIGILVIGANAAAHGVTLIDHAGAGICLASGSDNFRASAVEIAAPSLAIPPMDSACFGVYAEHGAGHVFNQLNIHDVSIGLITSIDVTRATITDCQVHDINGQHGLYLQNGTGLFADGIRARNIHLNGIKLQLNTTSTSDSFASTISNVNADNCGDCAVSVNNTAATLTAAKKIRGLNLANVVATRCGRGLYLGSVVGGSITNVTVTACRGDGITVLDCRDLSCTDWTVDECRRVGLRLNRTTGSVQDQITITRLRIQDPGLSGEAGYMFGIYDAQGTNLTFDRAVVTAPSGTMHYALFVASDDAADQSSLAVRNSEFLDANTGYGVRLEAGGIQLKEWSNNQVGGRIMNFPT